MVDILTDSEVMTRNSNLEIRYLVRPLLDAVYENNLSKVKKELFSSFVDKDELNEALLYSIFYNYLDIAILLISVGTQVTVIRDTFVRFKFVQYLIENGLINMNIVDEILIQSIKEIDIDLVKYLIQNGANIHIQNDLPLILASTEVGSLEIVKFLVEKGANIYAQNDLSIRQSMGPDIVEYLEAIVKRQDAGKRITGRLQENKHKSKPTEKITEWQEYLQANQFKR